MARRYPDLIELRKEAGKNQATVARELGVASSQVLRWERGQQMIPASIAPKYAVSLGVSLAIFLVAAEESRSRYVATLEEKVKAAP